MEKILRIHLNIRSEVTPEILEKLRESLVGQIDHYLWSIPIKIKELQEL